MQEKVTVIIPNYNGKHFMEPCLSSLEKQTFRSFRVLVVDNASTDGSLEFMAEKYPDIEVVALDQNYGFSRAVNEGIRRSRAPYVLLLNNDTTVDPHFLEEMVKAIRISPSIFSVSSRMIQMYHPIFWTAPEISTRSSAGGSAGEKTTRQTAIRLRTASLRPAPAPPSTGARSSERSDILTRPISLTWKTSTSATGPASLAGRTPTAPRPLSTT